MDWKEFTEQPDEGTYEKIAKRLRVRRALRIGLSIVGEVAIALAVLALIMRPSTKDENVAKVIEQPQQPKTEMTIQEAQQMLAPAAAATAQPQQVSKAAQIAEPMAVASNEPTADVSLTSLLPQSVFVPQAVAEPAAPCLSTTRYIGPADDTAKADIVIASPETSAKSGELAPEPYHEDDLLWVPNVIIPDGDVDDNRTFKIKASSEVSDFNIHIYNRRGQHLYTSNDPNFRWDATYKGAALPQGAYVWVATYRDGEGKPCRRAGEVLVLR